MRLLWYQTNAIPLVNARRLAPGLLSLWLSMLCLSQFNSSKLVSSFLDIHLNWDKTMQTHWRDHITWKNSVEFAINVFQDPKVIWIWTWHHGYFALNSFRGSLSLPETNSFFRKAVCFESTKHLILVVWFSSLVFCNYISWIMNIFICID